MERRSSFNLLAQVRGGIQQEPGAAIIRNGDLGLGATLAFESSGANGLTIPAATIPLRKAAASGRAQYLDTHSY
jgi:hypothetical protein